MPNKKIIEEILQASRAEFETEFATSVTVEPGQIRLLSNSDRGRGGQIVVVAKVEPWAELAEVILLNNLVEVATPRDFVSVSTNNSNGFDAVVWADFFGTADLMQLKDNPILGNLCKLCIESIYNSAQSSTGETATAILEHTCLKHGEYIPLINEEIWHMRNQNFASFYEKTIHLSEIQIAARQMNNSVFNQVEFRADLLRKCSAAQKTDEAIDALDDLTLSLVRM